jgi:hypothetical protein
MLSFFRVLASACGPASSHKAVTPTRTSTAHRPRRIDLLRILQRHPCPARPHRSCRAGSMPGRCRSAKRTAHGESPLTASTSSDAARLIRSDAMLLTIMRSTTAVTVRVEPSQKAGR